MDSAAVDDARAAYINFIVITQGRSIERPYAVNRCEYLRFIITLRNLRHTHARCLHLSDSQRLLT
jgi:hypothetical protein